MGRCECTRGGPGPVVAALGRRRRGCPGQPGPVGSPDDRSPAGVPGGGRDRRERRVPARDQALRPGRQGPGRRQRPVDDHPRGLASACWWVRRAAARRPASRWSTGSSSRRRDRILSTAGTSRRRTPSRSGGASGTSSSRSACSPTRPSATTWRPCPGSWAGTPSGGAPAPTSCWSWWASTRHAIATGTRPALGRRAAARGCRPGARRRPAGAAHGRALRGRRSHRPRTAPGRAAAAPGAHGADHPVRDPRHRRGDPPGRPGRGLPVGRHPRPVRHPGRDPVARRRRSSWLASWASDRGLKRLSLSRVRDLTPAPAVTATVVGDAAARPAQRAARPSPTPRGCCCSTPTDRPLGWVHERRLPAEGVLTRRHRRAHGRDPDALDVAPGRALGDARRAGHHGRRGR